MANPSQALTILFCKELSTLLSTASNNDAIRLLPDKTWLLSSVLAIHVSIELGDVLEALDAKASSSTLIHGYWHEEQDSVYVLMGQDVWQSTRCDRHAGSRVMTMVNNDPLDSVKRMQVIKLHTVPAEPGPCPGAMEHNGTELQVLAHFLRASLRLNPFDLSIVVTALAEGSLSLTPSFEGVSRHTSAALLTTARSALLHASTYKHLLSGAVRSTPSLVQLAEIYDISAADRPLQGIYTIMVQFSGAPAAEALRRRQPSFLHGLAHLAWRHRPCAHPRHTGLHEAILHACQLYAPAH
ncbi:hypothetical protein CLAFUW4_07400 [Fulvia fulva]|uniref:Uncharacterized protein n=1 Tax=Passalora fulva TaxID=5499 RepID=A0A9Q8UQ68_PASFU|nr:uncharacterized protein CLAFUR5_07530 [Fulvia fulva]KAK4621630.1 hypothetical protein CLAFUR4_07407 [Fulvia fulva]KAK4622441.1 hypothetical protein CLAFUR0_07406 [Fulvia fulva]UJO18582.1 hypothetical protein CLAFUR5_07530 [Fulvia fulva]WPV16827.1 hypothetical protein CLAFUW4_07400 [Fulvia fulva]WPV31149.1 hypothetical protein CLAFUW7_07403 [Fulvia fulva]